MLLSKIVVGTRDELLLLLLLLRWQRLRHVLLLMIGWLEVLLLRLRLVGKVRMVTLWGGRVQHKVPVALVQMRLLRRILLLLRLEVLIRTQRMMLLLLLGWWLWLALRGISPIAPIISPAIVVVVVKCGCRREWFSHFGRMVLSTSGRRRMLLTFRW